MDITTFEPSLDDKHEYAVGVRVEGGTFSPFQTYESEETARQGYQELSNEVRDHHRS